MKYAGISAFWRLMNHFKLQYVISVLIFYFHFRFMLHLFIVILSDYLLLQFAN